MGKNLIFTDKEAEFLKELVRQGVEFMIVGLSAANLQGVGIATADIDLWFRKLSDPRLVKVLKKLGGTYIPTVMMNPPQIMGPGLELFDIVLNVSGLGSFDKEKKNTIEIPLGDMKVRVLRLERIIANKEAAGRKKDKNALPVLRDALITNQELSASRKKN